MRRSFALALVLVFSLQSTASAASMRPDAFAPMLMAIRQSWLVMALMGQGQLYNEMHAAAPKIPKLTPVHLVPKDARAQRAPAIHRYGVPEIRRSRNVLILPKDAPRDPLAMSHRCGSLAARPAVNAPLVRVPCTPTAAPVPPSPTGPSKGHAQTLRAQTALPASTTGINRWWGYSEKALAGIGRAMVNVANGNLIVQADDVDVPARGIDLAFRRTYNSLSQHDVSNSDGSTPGLFGNGWTNTFDAHLAYDATQNVMSVYDIDGARYDYTADGSGNWIAPPGLQGTSLVNDGQCDYYWTKKTGTSYEFRSPDGSGICAPLPAGKRGKIENIFARNHNNSIHFTYSWANNDASTAENITQILAQQSDGQELTLDFSLVNGHDELSQLVRPDGNSVYYYYDSGGDLIEVDRPGGAVDAATRVPTNTPLCETYGYYAGHTMQYATSPDYCWSFRNTPSNEYGAYYGFAYDGSNRITAINDYADVNFAPADGYNSGPMQDSVAPGIQEWYSENFAWPTNAPMQETDTVGHSELWYTNGSGNVIEHQAWTGSMWLTTFACWDGQNNLTCTIDTMLGVQQRTDYAYDANGNAIEVQQPSVPTDLGQLRPTSLYLYDQYNNLISYCNPTWVVKHNLGSCPSGGANAAVTYHYNYSDSAEPYGYLINTWSPLSYETQFTYNQAAEGGDFGLPTNVTSAAYTQADGTTRSPSQSFGYDAYGNLTSYNDGSGSWTMVYDNLNRVVQRTDPDNVSSYTYYDLEGEVTKTETSSQHVTGDGSTFLYDPDGNEVQSQVYRTASSAASPAADRTRKWYDGEDRLVEVQQQQDPLYDVYTNAWATRYIYDISQNQPVSFNGAVTFYAHGNLYKTQEFLPNSGGPQTITNTALQVANTTWEDTKATAFDGLDRPVNKYSLVDTNNAGADSVSTESMSYDQNGNPGELTESCNVSQQCATFSYDARNAMSAVNYTDGSVANKTTVYDPDGRIASVSSPTFGTQTYTYDADGRETQEVEASGGGVTSPATFTHEYYPDGKLQQLDVSSSGLTQAGLFQYSYRADGRVQTKTINDAGNAKVGSTSVHYVYSGAGRITGRTETGTGANFNPSSWTYDQYGRTSGITVPTGSYSTFVYDPQGALLAYLTQLKYTARGELVSDGTGSNTAYSKSLFANGVHVGLSWSYGGSGYAKWDDRMGAVLANSTDTPDPSGVNPDAISSQGFEYDAAGRMISEGSSGSGTLRSGANATWSSVLARTYDAENHTIDTTVTGTHTLDTQGYSTYMAASANYVWGLGGHPIRIGTAEVTNSRTQVSAPAIAASQYETLHWDGNQLVFTSNSNGTVDDIKVGTEGDITPLDTGYSGLTFWDRGPGGGIMACHNATGASGNLRASNSTMFGNASPCSVVANGFTPPTSFVWSSGPTQGVQGVSVAAAANQGIGQGGLLADYRPDGFSDGFNAIQGVRTYDPTAGTWTTPDAYAGNVHDPASQKSYMWNGNNGVAYSDPSGFSPIKPGMLAMAEGAGEAVQFLADGAGGGPVATDDGSSADPPKAAGGAKSLDSEEAVGLAAEAGNKYNSISQRTHREYGGLEYRTVDGHYGYTVSADSGKHADSVDVAATAPPDGSTLIGTWHTHVWIPGYANNNFDNIDEWSDQKVFRVPGFLITPGGDLKMDTYMNYPFSHPYYPVILVTICESCIAH